MNSNYQESSDIQQPLPLNNNDLNTNLSKQGESIQKNKNIPNYNNIQLNNINQANRYTPNNKTFHIIETDEELYIVNTIWNDAIKIPKNEPNKIEKILNKEQIPKDSSKKLEVDTIIGIFDLNNVKYLGVVTSSKETATILFSKVYAINSIELIKLTKTNESKYLINLKTNIQALFSKQSFYYSKDYKLAFCHYYQRNNNNNMFNKYFINYSLLGSFFDNNVPEYFYSQIIFGFVSGQNNTIIGNNQFNIALDTIIIERYFKENIMLNNESLVYIKQIEFITVFKNVSNISSNKIFSHICYVSSESTNNIKTFVPFKIALVEELNQFKDIVCLINNCDKNIKNEKVNEIMVKHNKNFLDNKIKKVNYPSDWKKKFFEGIDIDKFVDFYSNDMVQQTSFWLIDINNNRYNNKMYIKILKRIFWKIIQREINVQVLNINLGDYLPNGNETLAFKRFYEFGNFYEKSIFTDKNPLLNDKYKTIFKEVFEAFITNNNALSQQEDFQIEENINSQNLTRLKILCATWNVGGAKLSDDYDISDLFTQIIFI